jgi:proteic killer suppression protein
VIRNFRDKETEKIFNQEYSKKIPRDIQKRALIKLMLLDAAEMESDLESPPGNRFKRLEGKRKDEFSIRINDQWRICFRFENGDALDVSIEDYH